ncbi:alpha/beta fold hydrolase [Maritimibacter sp. DP1N21-5]|uniref:alpha/beta fold hydrolase n=1 Tax=Maritimibacter sp. DP1N21-5 TaxID=2836867 RepID=UPI001C4977C2|nr:alpha/beta hydrolase [Maritimibacter sp. DP1N21-5]
MAEPSYLDTADGRRIAYHVTTGAGPGVIFLGGFMSDMEGTKALVLEDWAKARGQAFLRFDYSGHGQSGGAFTDGTISDWAADAAAVISHATTGPQIFVGSSMGGWITCLLARRMPERFAGFVGIAAAPDFTEDSMWRDFSDAERVQLREVGTVLLPSEYGDPYPITRRLIEDGRENLVLRAPLVMEWPVRLFQGTEDEDVERQVALNLLDHIEGSDLRLTFVKGADHRFSSPGCLDLLTGTLDDLLA